MARVQNRASLLPALLQLTADDLLEAGAAPRRVAIVEGGRDHLDPPDHEAAATLLAELGVPPGRPYLLKRVHPGAAQEPAPAARRLRPRPSPAPLAVAPRGGRPVGGGAGPWKRGPTSCWREGSPAPRRPPSNVGARLLAYVPLREGWGLPAVEGMVCWASRRWRRRCPARVGRRWK